MFQRVHEGLDRVSLMSRVMVRSGLTPQRLHPRVLIAAVREQRKGGGPSAIYRIQAAAQPEHSALEFHGRAMTYRELDQRIDQLAAGLVEDHGIKKGDSVLLMMRNRPEAITIQGAMNRIGGGAVAVSYRSTPKELEYLVNHSGAKAIFVEDVLTDAVDAARTHFSNVPSRNYFVIGENRSGFLPYEELRNSARLQNAAEEGAVVIYTSGTTGKPKGAVRKFPKEAMNTVFRVLLDLPLRGDDRHLCVCPLYHSTAIGFVGFSMILGATVVIENEFDPEKFLATIERERITTTAVVPTMLHRVLALPDETIARYDTRTLRAVISGGAPLSGTLARRFIERFGHILYNFYGATETGINTIATSAELLLAPGTIGHMVSGNEIRLLDDDGNEVPTGRTGEVFVRNGMLVAGYHQDENATRASLREGFFSVGDLAHRDEHGLFHIDGRKRDMIISGGVNVYPAEIEETLQRHPAVQEAAVVGVPDDEWGERVRAFVVLRNGHEIASEEIVAFCKRELAGPKVPREVRFLDELPKNPTGKILKRQLREA